MHLLTHTPLHYRKLAPSLPYFTKCTFKDGPDQEKNGLRMPGDRRHVSFISDVQRSEECQRWVGLRRAGVYSRRAGMKAKSKGIYAVFKNESRQPISSR